MLTHTHLLTAVAVAAAGLFATGLSAQNTVVTQERSTVTYSPTPAANATLALPAGITSKNLNEDKSIDKAFKAIAEDALSRNNFDNLVGMLVDQDRDRIKKSAGSSPLTNVDGNSNKRLNDLAVSLSGTFKSKYNHDFDMDYSKVFTPVFIQIMTGEVADPAALAGKWPVDAGMAPMAGKVTVQEAQQARDKAFGGDVNLDKGRNVAIAQIKSNRGVPTITTSMIHENLTGWKFDVPNTLTAQKLYDNLVANLNFIDQHKAELPVDISDGYRHVTHAVIAAIYDIDLSKGTAAANRLDPGSVRPADGTPVPVNPPTVINR